MSFVTEITIKFYNDEDREQFRRVLRVASTELGDRLNEGLGDEEDQEQMRLDKAYVDDFLLEGMEDDDG